MKNTSKIYLIHGWGGSRKSLEPLSEELKKLGYATCLLELPGHGETEEMSSPWDMKNFALWLRSKIVDEKYILIGHSFGGKIILEGVSSKLLNPLKIILIDANGIKPKKTFKKRLWMYISKITKILNKGFLKSAFNRCRFYIYRYIIREIDYVKTSGNVRESFKLFNEQHYDDKLSAIRTPSLIIWGREDLVTPLWMGEQLNKGIKKSQLDVLEGTHGLPLKKPLEVAKAIDVFMQAEDTN